MPDLSAPVQAVSAAVQNLVLVSENFFVVVLMFYPLLQCLANQLIVSLKNLNKRLENKLWKTVKMQY